MIMLRIEWDCAVIVVDTELIVCDDDDACCGNVGDSGGNARVVPNWPSSLGSWETRFLDPRRQIIIPTARIWGGRV